MYVNMKLLGVGVAAVGLGGVGVGVGIVFGSLVLGISRNPSMEQRMFRYTIMGFAMTEAMGLFVLMIIFMLLFS